MDGADETVTIFFDGGTRPTNPGPSVGAAVLYGTDGRTLRHVAEYRAHATNNAAEALGLVLGLRAARALGARDVVVRGDSEFIINAMLWDWGCTNPEVAALLAEARALLKGFSPASARSLKAVPRRENAAADGVVNLLFAGAYVPDMDLEDALARLGKVRPEDPISFTFLVEMTVRAEDQAAFLALPEATRRKAIRHFARAFEADVARFAAEHAGSVDAKASRISG